MASLKQYLIFDPKVSEVQQLIYGWIVVAFVFVLGLITIIDVQSGLQWQTLALRFFCLALFVLSIIIGRLANSYRAAAFIFCAGMLAEVYPNVILTETAMRLEVYWYPVFVLITGLFLNFRIALYLTLVHTIVLFVILQKNLELGSFFLPEAPSILSGVTIELKIRFFCAVLLSSLFALRFPGRFRTSWVVTFVFTLFAISTWVLKTSTWGELHPLFQASFLWILPVGFMVSKTAKVILYVMSIAWVFYIIDGSEFAYDKSMRMNLDQMMVLGAMAFNFVALAYIYFNEKHSLKRH